MLTVTEFVPQWTAPNLNEAFPRTTSKPELGEIVVFTDNRSDAASILEFFLSWAPMVTPHCTSGCLVGSHGRSSMRRASPF
jgi:hypothetical protein